MAKTIGGRRLVPIETGRSYVDEGWGQKILTFKEFMDQYILQNPTSSALALGYLAQHDLFAQFHLYAWISLSQIIAIRLHRLHITRLHLQTSIHRSLNSTRLY